MNRPTLPVSVIIPTRNRPGEVATLLEALSRQRARPAEVLLMDASHPPLDRQQLRMLCGDLPLKVVPCPPHLCLQKNRGLSLCGQPFILFCDDDMDPPPAYLERLCRFLLDHPEENAASGLVLEPTGDGSFQSIFPDTLPALVWKFCFQLSVWAPLPEPSRWAVRFLLEPVRRWYRRRGNGWTLAGWPLITCWSDPLVHTAFYGLGACMVRKKALPQAPFASWLDAHGIGDNYGLALRLPYPPGIAVLTDLPIPHRRSLANRLNESERFARRLQALVGFVKADPRFSWPNRLWLGWSLVGLGLQAWHAGRPERWRGVRAALHALFFNSGFPNRRTSAAEEPPPLDTRESTAESAPPDLPTNQ